MESFYYGDTPNPDAYYTALESFYHADDISAEAHYAALEAFYCYNMARGLKQQPQAVSADKGRTEMVVRNR